MDICICKEVSETKIRNAIHRGAESLELVREKTGACTDCQCCSIEIIEILDELKPGWENNA